MFFLFFSPGLREGQSLGEMSILLDGKGKKEGKKNIITIAGWALQRLNDAMYNYNSYVFNTWINSTIPNSKSSKKTAINIDNVGKSYNLVLTEVG